MPPEVTIIISVRNLKTIKMHTEAHTRAGTRKYFYYLINYFKE